MILGCFLQRFAKPVPSCYVSCYLVHSRTVILILHSMQVTDVAQFYMFTFALESYNRPVSIRDNTCTCMPVLRCTINDRWYLGKSIST